MTKDSKIKEALKPIKLIALLTLLLTSHRALADEMRLQWEKPFIVLSLKENSAYETLLLLRNTSDKKIYVDRIQASCGCVSAVFCPQTIDAGQSINVMFKIPDSDSALGKTISVVATNGMASLAESKVMFRAGSK